MYHVRHFPGGPASAVKKLRVEKSLAASSVSSFALRVCGSNAVAYSHDLKDPSGPFNPHSSVHSGLVTFFSFMPTN
jgi:hypothetical protein